MIDEKKLHTQITGDTKVNCEKQEHSKKLKLEVAGTKESGRRYRGDAHVGVLRMFVTKIDVGSGEKFQLSLKLT